LASLYLFPEGKNVAPTQCTAFENFWRIAQGTPQQVRAELKKLRATREPHKIMVFDDQTGEDFDLEGDSRFNPDNTDASTETGPVREKPRGPGRPKLGVVAREITLLPRHWEWLESQPGGSSVALRKLVEIARKQGAPEDQIRRSIESTYRFLSVMCGHLAGFEEIARALFRRNWQEFDRLSEELPDDLRNYLRQLSQPARPELIHS
jgi:hypothetical protein